MSTHAHEWQHCDCPACPGCFCLCGDGRSEELRAERARYAKLVEAAQWLSRVGVFGGPSVVDAVHDLRAALAELDK